MKQYSQSPFPGMDPYLEGPAQWSDFHSTFIHALREAIGDLLPEPYFARVTELVMMVIELLDPYTEPYIEILRLPDVEPVTVIELFSPTNKYGDGRGAYADKRNRLLRTPVNLFELDLIRAGPRLRLSRPVPDDDYLCSFRAAIIDRRVRFTVGRSGRIFPVFQSP